MRVTAQMIADLAGVSRGTVDRALHNRGQVSPEVKDRILRIAEELNYRPNKIASALVKSRRKFLVKLIIHNLSSNYWNELKSYFLYFSKEYIDFGIRLEIFSLKTDEPQEMIEAIDECIDSKPDYIIIAPFNLEEVRNKIKKIINKKIPLLTIDTVIENNPSPCHIGTDPSQDGRVMAGIFNLVYKRENPRVLILFRYQHHRSSYYRSKFFIKELEDLDQNFLVVEEAPITGLPQSSYYKTRKLLEKHKDLDAIYVASGNTEGVCNAVIDSKLHKNIRLFAYDITGKLRHYLDENIVTATLCGSNKIIAEKAMETVANELIQGIKPNSDIITPNIIKLKQSADIELV